MESDSTLTASCYTQRRYTAPIPTLHAIDCRITTRQAFSGSAFRVDVRHPHVHGGTHAVWRGNSYSSTPLNTTVVHLDHAYLLQANWKPIQQTFDARGEKVHVAGGEVNPSPPKEGVGY